MSHTEWVRPSDWRSSPAQVARCLFCGNVGVWWDCRCPTATLIQAGKAEFRMISISRGGKMVITECSLEVMRAIRLAGVLSVSEPGNPELSVTRAAPVSVTEPLSVTDGDELSVTRCEVCGTAFEVSRKTARYCSAACRQKAYRNALDPD
jgi:hypothetical protein